MMIDFPLRCILLAVVASISHAKVDVCSLPQQPGRCLAYMSMYYFSAKSGECDWFVYGGCGGNGNRFWTIEECQNTCGVQTTCSLPKVTGFCKAYIPSYYFNTKSGLCEKFIYGGCGGNANRFQTLDQCRNTCGGADLCRLPKVVGPCRALFPRLYFNHSVKQCERFIYGGCSGNGNNFKTIDECEFQCL